ncbi:MAG: hypothetical protein ACYDHP_04360 [Ferrimicrobium sp.]
MLSTVDESEQLASVSHQVTGDLFSSRTGEGSSVITSQYGLLRDWLRMTHSDVVATHQELVDDDLTIQSQLKAKKSVRSLLEELSTERGMSWRDISRLIGVSVSAVRKWRQDGASQPENRLALARLAAFLDLLEGLLVQDPAAWLELPVIEGFTVCYLDLYEAGRPELILDILNQRLSPTAALDIMNPNWRTCYTSDFEVFEATDGNLSIRLR